MIPAAPKKTSGSFEKAEKDGALREIEEALDAHERALHVEPGTWTLASELDGGASTRRFFRVVSPESSAIAMYTPLPSQEISKAKQASGNGPFLQVQQLLAAHDLPVPKIIAEEHGKVLLVEDLGDFTLARHLEKYPEDRELLYKQAIELLARARLALLEPPPESSICQRAFDEELLRWEVEHFKDWVLEARGIFLNSQQASIFDNAANFLAKHIAALPRGFVHRDYQSRNLMVVNKGLVWIDFQDAMMGPRAYDLVALLTDSYQSFSPNFIEERLEQYAALTGSPLQELRQEFDLITVQRKLKDAGRFIFIDRQNSNSQFLKFVNPTIRR
ncbi:MAG: phosphotransferase, partial [Polyangiaceae bacterium]|nr:phosphotransferase [Polyangiaceae bacterium]